MEQIARNDETVVSLGQGIPSRSVPPELHQAAINAMMSGSVDTYSDPRGLQELRHSLANHLEMNNMNYKMDEIIVTAGAIEALSATLRTLIDDTKYEIIVPTPVYSAYFKVIETARGHTIQQPLIEHENWRLDSDELISRMNEHTAAVLVCNPNNPTGTIFEEDVLIPIIQAAEARGIPVIIDEVYRNMVYDNETFFSPATVSAYKDTIIRIMSFSKDFSLTGWRVGYVHAAQSYIDSILGVHDTLVNCAPVISQHVALEALRHHDRIVHDNRVCYQAQWRLMKTYLDKLSGIIEYTPPAAGYCVFPRFLNSMDSEALAYQFANEGVVTVAGSAFGDGGEGHIRLCFGRSSAAINVGMQRITRSLS